MDGVLVDSERYWSQAEREIFEELGVILTPENTIKTKSMTADQVIEFWYHLFPWQNVSFKEVEQRVVDRIIYLIETTDCVIPGIKNFIENLKNKGYKLGLATNSPYRLVPVVLEKTDTAQFFDALSSAEFEQNGKPHPDIYVNTAKKLGVNPDNCIVIEDSYYGMQAAKAAGMKVWAFTAGNAHLKFDIADGHIHDFAEKVLF